MNTSFTYSQAFEADEYESVIYIHASSRGISNMNASFTYMQRVETDQCEGV